MTQQLGAVQGPYFGDFGGRYVPEALVAALDDLTEAWERLRVDSAFTSELDRLARTYSGRPSILTEAPKFARHAGGARVLLKREDLNHTGSHKINNVLGQALLTQTVGKTRVIAETGAGQHGVATATAAALLGLECTIYMGAQDVRRQSLNVARMEILGAKVVSVSAGSATLKDAINEAFRDWVANVDSTNYVFGTAAGPHPLPGARARPSEGHRGGGPRPGARADGRAARRRRRVRRRRIERHRPVQRLPRRPLRADRRLRGGVSDCYNRLRIRLDEAYESLKIVSQCLDRLEEIAARGEDPSNTTMVADPTIAWPARMSIATDGQGQSLEHVREIMGSSMESLIHHFKLVTQGFRVPAGRSTRPLSTPRGSWASTPSPTAAPAPTGSTSATPPSPTCSRWP